MFRTKSREQMESLCSVITSSASTSDLIRRDRYRTEAEEGIEAVGARQVPRIFSKHIKRGEIERGHVAENHFADLAGQHEPHWRPIITPSSPSASTSFDNRAAAARYLRRAGTCTRPVS